MTKTKGMSATLRTILGSQSQHRIWYPQVTIFLWVFGHVSQRETTQHSVDVCRRIFKTLEEMKGEYYDCQKDNTKSLENALLSQRFNEPNKSKFRSKIEPDEMSTCFNPMQISLKYPMY